MPSNTRLLRLAQKSGQIQDVQTQDGRTIRGVIHSVSFRTVWILSVPTPPAPDTGDHLLRLSEVAGVRPASHPSAGVPAA